MAGKNQNRSALAKKNDTKHVEINILKTFAFFTETEFTVRG